MSKFGNMSPAQYRRAVAAAKAILGCKISDVPKEWWEESGYDAYQRFVEQDRMRRVARAKEQEKEKRYRKIRSEKKDLRKGH